MPSLLVAIVTAFITVRLSLKQFRSQQWWEKRFEAYTRIVEALHHLIDYCESHAKEDMTGVQIEPERRKQLEEAYARSFDELTKAANVGSFIISSKAADLLEKLRTRDKDWESSPPWEIYTGDAHAYRKALADIRELAKRDLA